MSTTAIDLTEDILDSRDIIARIRYLEIDEEGGDEEEREELRRLREFAKQGERFGDWHHGETFIRDDYFLTYAQEFAEDIGAIGETAWPACHIDWEAAADSLKMDYTSVDVDGITYWGRS